jgi:hypothetical protein
LSATPRSSPAWKLAGYDWKLRHSQIAGSHHRVSGDRARVAAHRQPRHGQRPSRRPLRPEISSSAEDSKESALLIGGSTIYDEDTDSLLEILTELTSSNSFNTRVHNLTYGTGGLPILDDTTVIDDGVINSSAARDSTGTIGETKDHIDGNKRETISASAPNERTMTTVARRTTGKVMGTATKMTIDRRPKLYNRHTIQIL